MTAKRISLVLLMLLLLIAVMAFAPALDVGGAEAAGKNTLNFDNKSGQDVLVRVFDKNSDKRLAEVEVRNGQTRGTSIADGDYYIVARYAVEPGQDGNLAYSYSKGDPFEIKPPAGKRSTVTITLHGVIGGNYGAVPTDRSAFESGESNPAKAGGEAKTVDEDISQAVKDQLVKFLRNRWSKHYDDFHFIQILQGAVGEVPPDFVQRHGAHQTYCLSCSFKVTSRGTHGPYPMGKTIHLFDNIIVIDLGQGAMQMMYLFPRVEEVPPERSQDADLVSRAAGFAETWKRICPYSLVTEDQ